MKKLLECLIIILISVQYTYSQLEKFPIDNNKNKELQIKHSPIVAKHSIDVRSTPVLLNNNVIWEIKEGDTINVLGFKNDFLSVKKDKKTGYCYFIHFESYPELKGQIDSLKDIENIVNERERIRQFKIDSLTAQLNSLELEKAIIEEKIYYYQLAQKFKKMGSPLVITNAIVSFNSINNPEANITVINISNKIIDAFTVEIFCYNNFNQPVNHYLYRKNIFKGISQEEININEPISCFWDLFGHDNTTKIKVVLKKVHFKNNSTWTAKNNNVFTKSN